MTHYYVIIDVVIDAPKTIDAPKSCNSREIEKSYP